MSGSTGVEQYITMEEYLEGRRCIITGSGGTIGRLFASYIASRGGTPIMVDVVPQEETEEAVAAYGGEYSSHRVDLGDVARIRSFYAEIAERYGFAGLAASHCVGHTRMATESAVSPAHAHPFTAGEDFCLVHNGSLSNSWSLRRRLEKRGVDFETDNDTEAACRFLEWRMREGESLEDALKAAFVELDGFYTLLMATAEKLVLVRDAFACKPAVVAETEDYVAVSSEFRSLAHLPGIRSAELFEPVPEEIYSWSL